jgi:universal bacterial protein YeaZ
MNETWLLALESSTSHGGAALLRDGEIVEVARLEEGLRHGRELMPAAETLISNHSITAQDVAKIGVSIGPGSYTGIRVGVMSAKSFAYASGCEMAVVSSLAAMALTAQLDGAAEDGNIVVAAQDARRDEVYVAVYRLLSGNVETVIADAAVAPEEVRDLLLALRDKGETPVLAGSAFATYASLFDSVGGATAIGGAVNPGAVGLLAWRQILQGKTADPLAVQPVYLRRDGETDWAHDILISTGKSGKE